MKYIVVFITAQGEEQAKKIAEQLLAKRLIACANILPRVSSLFWWQGRIDSAEEVLLILKTKECLLDEIIAATKELHSYEVPEIIALPIIGGNEDYLKWIDESVKDGKYLATEGTEKKFFMDSVNSVFSVAKIFIFFSVANYLKLW